MLVHSNVKSKTQKISFMVLDIDIFEGAKYWKFPNVMQLGPVSSIPTQHSNTRGHSVLLVSEDVDMPSDVSHE